MTSKVVVLAGVLFPSPRGLQKLSSLSRNRCHSGSPVGKVLPTPHW